MKYTTKNGIHTLDPDWKPTSSTVPFTNRATALAVVSAPDEEEDIVVTPMYEAAVAQYHEEFEQDGLEELNQVLAKYEVPAGLLSKLLQLRDFDVAEIIVDDSGSMTLGTDAKGPNGESLTRWWEAKHRISQMLEIMAHVIAPPVNVRFLNRPDVLDLKRHDGEAPAAYIERTETVLLEAFQRGPNGGTPAREVIEASLSRYDTEKSVLRYFLGDGVPNGGAAASRKIEDMLVNRVNPEKNPFTFMSCTADDAQVEWMKNCEEKAPFCSEFDDYGDESREILKDQGEAFPYSFGLHLVAQIVAAFNPHDLDAMDESVPFTKQTLDSLLGYQSSPEEYKYYFDSFVTAQRKLPLKSHQRQFVDQLPSLYQQFESTAVAKDIPAAAEYKNKLKSMQMHQRELAASSSYPSSQPPQDGCCIIL